MYVMYCAVLYCNEMQCNVMYVCMQCMYVMNVCNVM